VRARAWERCADTAIDPILINLSYWTWAGRDDRRPESWVAAAQRDLEVVYAVLERDDGSGDFVCGELSIADIALFPHLTSTRALGVGR
jgi:glutathione S-transferase